MNRLNPYVAAGLLLGAFLATEAFGKTIEYSLTIEEKTVRITGRPVGAMTINGTIPGPVLRFTEGDAARIRVTNRMTVETSIHWHGLLVPPGMDGVPNLSFPPIAPGATFTYAFPIRQSGTYWYHSHTDLQEQKGVYGPIVITPAHADPVGADRDHVVMLSDWTDERPSEVLRTLKSGSEWYALEKGSSQSILGAARAGRLGAYFTREWQRMPPMDIADVAYDRFLANGESDTSLKAAPGERVRLRVIDGSATTYFHVEFAGGPMTIVAADGQAVDPIDVRRLLVGVAETYDVIVTMPADGAYELRATAHDGSGFASAWIGSGMRHPAPAVPAPNLYHTMGHGGLLQSFAFTPAGVMGMPDSRVEAGEFDRPGMMPMGAMEDMAHGGHSAMGPGTDTTGGIMAGHGMAMDAKGHGEKTGRSEGSDMAAMKDQQKAGHPGHRPGPDMAEDAGMEHKPKSMGSGHAVSPPTEAHGQAMASTGMGGNGPTPADKPLRTGRAYGSRFGLMAADISSRGPLAVDGVDPSRPWPPYEKLRALEPTALAPGKPLREIRLTLDGDMERYVWFLNDRPLSESDVIRIRQGEAVRFIMINRTMMHHPMHLHGHFFRVLNGQGDHAPLKHTVDVAPMSTTVIEFDANEVGDWFFHCHLLYHMKSGMARVVGYEGFTPDADTAALLPTLFKDPWYVLGRADLLSNMTEGVVSASNSRNILAAEWEAGWQEVDDTEWEGVLTWDRYANRFLSVFVGVDVLGVEDEVEHSRGVLGIRYLLPVNIEFDAWADSEGGGRFAVEKHLDLTPRVQLFGEAEYDTHEYWEGKAGVSYLVSKRFSLLGQWHSEFGFGGGAQVRF